MFAIYFGLAEDLVNTPQVFNIDVIVCFSIAVYSYTHTQGQVGKMAHPPAVRQGCGGFGDFLRNRFLSEF